MTEEKAYLPLGSIVIIKGTFKKLMVVNRASVVENQYFDYGAVLYPEGMIDSNLAYFNNDDIVKVVSKAYTDDDDALMVEQLLQAKEAFLDTQAKESKPTESMISDPVEEDPFASVSDMEDEA